MFAEAINYFKGDYQRTNVGLDITSRTSPDNTTHLGNFAKDLFNGNIASTITNTAFNLTTASSTPNIMAQAYRYDILNRLTDTYAETQAENFTAYKVNGTGDDAYSLHMSYDANGNIMSMIRNSMTAGTKMDDLTYKKGVLVNDYYGHPKKQKNKTEYLEDAAGDLAGVADLTQYSATYDANNTSTHNFEYDEKGRLKTDKARNIELIEYTVYDKIKKVHFTTASGKPDVEFTYNSKQQRQTKKIIPPSGGGGALTTIYSYDASGILMATYEYSNDGSGYKYKLNEQEIYGLNRIGNYKVNEVLVNSPTAVSNDASKLRFEITDHRGDVRAVVTGVKDASNNPNIVSLQDNDAWGFTFQGRNFVSENSRYGYQGSERDPELLDGSFYTTDFRGLDVARGEWWMPDAITQPWQSSYVAMDNNPVALTDVMGLNSGGPRLGGSSGVETPCPTFGGSSQGGGMQLGGQDYGQFAANIFNNATGSNIGADAIKQFTITQTSTSVGNVTATVTSISVSDGSTTVMSTTTRLVYNSVLNQSTDIQVNPIDGMVPIPLANQPPNAQQEYLFTDVRVFSQNGEQMAEGGDAGGADPPEGDGGVGEPGFWESLIPIWGSGREAIADFQNGDYVWGTINTALAVSDVFLVKAAVVAVTKIVVRTAAKEVIKETAEQGSKRLLLGTARDNLLNSVKNSKLKNIVNDLYRKGAAIGSGSTADYIRKFADEGHIIKGKNYIKALQKLLDAGLLDAKDKEIAEYILNDLKDALKSVGR